jgi:hypothetical protein
MAVTPVLNDAQQLLVQQVLTNYVNRRTAYQSAANQSMTADTLAQYNSDLATAQAVLTLVGGPVATPNLAGNASEDSVGLEESEPVAIQ